MKKVYILSVFLLPPSSSSHGFLFKRGNVGLARLLLAVYDAGPEGISTYKLLHQLGSTHHAKAFIARAERAGYIKREEAAEPGPGQFPPVINTITNKGKKLLLSQLL
jgi:hypothetical protein